MALNSFIFGRSILAGLLLAGCTMAGTAAADEISDFYGGKTVTIVVGFGPGGGYDLTARLVADHLGRHIPGRPGVIVKNMPGSASVVAANFIYNAAPKDGTQLGTFLNNIVLHKVLGGQGRYEPERFHWLGRVGESSTFFVLWHTVPVHSIADAKRTEVVVAATGATGHSAIVPWTFNRLSGTKFKVVPGYQSSATAALALEQGEAHAYGSASWDFLTQRKPSWLTENRLTFLYVNDLTRHPAKPDVPTIVELAENDEDRKVLRLLASAAALGRSFVAPPGVPEPRVQALRAGFAALVTDQAFLADAKKRTIDVSAVSGAEVEAVVREAAMSPADLVARTKTAIVPPK